ncbi:MAG: SAM-dependent chlorinase/fluorinase [Desulfovibrio sp.]|nr:SAM-dependent chlorinase/fluorinase [Desulfovibrio sp.]
MHQRELHRTSRPVIGLVTDFGLSDPYVGQMKAVLASLAPEAVIVDITHGVPPHDILRGAFFLDVSLPWLPPGAVLAAVVDPGVGSDRRMVCLEARGRLVLAPDNGLVSLTIGREEVAGAWSFAAPEMASATFHGRDVFAPLAATLAGGEHPMRLGLVIDPASLVVLPGIEPCLAQGAVSVVVLHTDRFGNAILGLEIERWKDVLDAAPRLAVRSPVRRTVRRVTAYAALAPGELGLLAGSQGYFELAMNRISAAETLGLASGDGIILGLDEEE